MMKKVLYGVALTLLASASVGSLQSCKDDVNDLKTQTSYDLNNLKNVQADLEKRIKALEDEMANKQPTSPNDPYVTMSQLDVYAKLKYLNDLIYGLNKVQNGDKSEYYDPEIGEDGILGMIKGILEALDDKADKNHTHDPSTGTGCSCNQDLIAAIEKALWPDGWTEGAESPIYDLPVLRGKITANEKSIEEILKFLNGYINGVDAEGNPIVGSEQQSAYLTLKDRLEAIQKDIFALANKDAAAGPLGRVTLLENDVKDLKAKDTELAEKDDALEAKIKDLLEEVQKIENTFLQVLNDRIDNLITSIKVERAISPVFGDFAAPIGIKSNILFNWYGLSDNGANVPFPNGMAGEVGENINLPTGENIVKENGYFADEVELGDVYVTVNPVGHMFDGTKLKFTTSAGKDLDIEVVLKEENEYELMYGINNTRAAEEVKNNGFYKAKVTAKNADINSIKLSIDEKLQTAMENAVNAQTKRNAASLIKAIYDQMSDVMKAYALRYDWTSKYYNGDASIKTEQVGEGDDATNVETPVWKSDVYEKGYAVLSGYDLAVAAARPLGFNFLKGKGASSDKVPTIDHLNNFVKELIDKNLKDLKIEGKDMEIDGHKIGFAEGKVRIRTENEKSLVAYVSDVTVDGNAIGNLYTVEEDGKQVTIKAVKTTQFTDPAETSTFINKALSTAIADVISSDKNHDSQAYREIQSKVEASVDIALLQMQKQINEVLKEVNGQIHDAFDGMGNSAQSYINKANRAIDLYNKVANKVNAILKNPNHYLQAAAFYAAGSNIGILSNNSKSPTVFTGSGNTITLYLSTFTGEIIAPAYKKYVAVTNGANANDINSNNEALNEVLDGSRIAVDVDITNFKSNEVYELTYQAVDYRGFYSTRKCYIKVVK